jgi:thiamine kinase-like enzyme
MMESMENSRYQKIREKESPSVQAQAGSNFMIDIPTLKKLLNRPNCDFILSLIQGT